MAENLVEKTCTEDQEKYIKMAQRVIDKVNKDPKLMDNPKIKERFTMAESIVKEYEIVRQLLTIDDCFKFMETFDDICGIYIDLTRYPALQKKMCSMQTELETQFQTMDEMFL